MIDEKKLDPVDLIDMILDDFKERGLELDTALAIAGGLFGALGQAAKLGPDQFLKMCKEMIEEVKWPEKIVSLKGEKE